MAVCMSIYQLFFYGNNLDDLQLFCLSNPDMDQLDPVLFQYTIKPLIYGAPNPQT